MSNLAKLINEQYKTWMEQNDPFGNPYSEESLDSILDNPCKQVPMEPMTIKFYSFYDAMQDRFRIELDIHTQSKSNTFYLMMDAHYVYGTEPLHMHSFLANRFAIDMLNQGWSKGDSNQVYKWIIDALANDHSKLEDVKAMGGVFSNTGNEIPTTYKVTKKVSEAAKLSAKLPGVTDMVLSPCGCYRDGLELNEDGTPNMIKAEGKKQEVWGLVQHLNDVHKWSREKIADWLDEMHDGGYINIEF